ncbi:MAG: YitT family protein [Eubacteriales bacterium]|nr:YitT family protein [Eubacteriales bacterium]
MNKNRVKGLLVDCIGGFLIACGLVIFAKDAGFAPGGIQGLALILYHYTKLPLGALTLFLNIPLILLSYKLLGRRFILRTLQSVIISSIFTDFLGPFMPSYQGDPMLASVFAASLIGLGLALIYQVGSSTGGTDLVIFSLRKLRPDLSVGQVTNLINAVIISLGGFVFKNIDAVLYGFIFTLVLATTVDKIMYGFSSGKMAFIISDHAELLATVIGEKVKRGSTIIPAVGGYTKQPRDLIMVVCTRRQLQLLREVVQNDDPDALLIVSEFNAVYGHGFLPLMADIQESDLQHLEGRESDLSKDQTKP